MCADKYCGIGKVPAGKKRGSAKYCLEKNQVRYYGLEQIDQKLIDKKNAEAKKLDLTKEQLKLHKIKYKAQGIIRRHGIQKVIANSIHSSYTDKEREAARKKMREYEAMKPIIKAQFDKQKAVIAKIKDEMARKEKREKLKEKEKEKKMKEKEKEKKRKKATKAVPAAKKSTKDSSKTKAKPAAKKTTKDSSKTKAKPAAKTKAKPAAKKTATKAKKK